jgi:hypothetical protein
VFRRSSRWLAALALAAVVPVPSPAHAMVHGTFSGTATIPRFGTIQPITSAYAGHFEGTFTGIVNNVPYVSTPVYAEFSYDESSAACPLVGIANGNAWFPEAGYWTTFAWTRTGLTAIITTSNGFDSGIGVATFVADLPIPCPVGGTTVHATVNGTLDAVP